MDINYEYSNIVTTLALGGVFAYSLISLARPQHQYRAYLILLMMFTGTFYGLSEAASFTIYTRGAGVLGSPIINFYLLVIFVYMLLMPVGSTTARTKDPIMMPALIMCGYILIYISYGLLSGLSLKNILSPFGAVNVIYMFVFYYILKASFRDSKDIYLFMRIFLTVATFMALYGLVRMLFFGGDPANYYSNVQKLEAKLTYFDIMQSATFCVAGAYVFLNLRSNKLAKKNKSILLLSLYFLNIAFSFRRTAWIGTMLVLSSITMSVKGRWRVASVILIVVMTLILAVVYQARFAGKVGQQQTTLTSDITNKEGLSIKEGRFAELYYAVVTVGDNYVVGLGPWGTNKPRISAYRDVDLVHSSFVHMYIKLGLIGLGLYILLIVRYANWWLKVRKKKWSNERLRTVAEAFVLGLLFELPDIAFGTPLITFRHTQFLALFMAIPVICWRINLREESN